VADQRNSFEATACRHPRPPSALPLLFSTLSLFVISTLFIHQSSAVAKNHPFLTLMLKRLVWHRLDLQRKISLKNGKSFTNSLVFKTQKSFVVVVVHIMKVNRLQSFLTSRNHLLCSESYRYGSIRLSN